MVAGGVEVVSSHDHPNAYVPVEGAWNVSPVNADPLGKEIRLPGATTETMSLSVDVAGHAFAVIVSPAWRATELLEYHVPVTVNPLK